jgi:integrase
MPTPSYINDVDESAADALAVVPVPGPLGGTLAPLLEAAREFAIGAKAENTRKAYLADWVSFEAWCAAQDPQPQALPADLRTVAAYLTALAQRGREGRPGTPLCASSITRALSGIAYRHRQAGYTMDLKHPQLRDVLQGIRRNLKVAPRQKTPVSDADLAAMIATLGPGLLANRDRAMILLGWHGALRRSELVALDVDDLRFVKEGIIVRIRSSKTDQEGEGEFVGIPFTVNEALCAVRATRAWLNAAGHSEGAFFRVVGVGCVGDRLDGSAVATAVKRAAQAAGLDEKKFSGHSLRSGFATTAAEKGKELHQIMKQGRWKSAEVCLGYIRSVSLFKDNAAKGLV